MITSAVFLMLLRIWHVEPREDYTGTLYRGPNSPADAFCWVDPLGGVHVNDLPNCLVVLQNLQALDTAQRYIEADSKHFQEQK